MAIMNRVFIIIFLFYLDSPQDSLHEWDFFPMFPLDIHFYNFYYRFQACGLPNEPRESLVDLSVPIQKKIISLYFL